jgi:TolB-like protein/DNA-binding winged helix-turn-helix (wHTH) protein/Tfp pilus assembly protein PilF
MNGNFRIGEWLVEPQLNSLSSADSSIRIEPKVMEVLIYLAGHAGEVVSKERLIEVIWEDRFVTDEVLTTSIWELRKALGDEARNPRFIQTVPRKGYRLIAPVLLEEKDEETVPQAEEMPLPNQESKSKLDLKRKAAIAGGIISILALLIIFKVAVWTHNSSKNGATQISSIAVLPLKNLSSEAEQDYFADAMTEALITDLAKLTPLRVTSRTSVMKYKNIDKPMSEIAGELGVDAVVEGSVLREGNRVRITIQLIKAATDQHLWAESYERDLGNILALQGEVAQTIAREIKTNLSLQEEVYQANNRPTDPEAYEAYLKGCQLLEKISDSEMEQSVEYFERAIQLDPNFAPAHAQLANAYCKLVSFNLVRPEDAYPKARTAAQKAIQLDNRLAEAHALLALVKLAYDWDWDGAEKGFKEALSINPINAQLHNWYGQYLLVADQKEESVKEMKRAQDLNPGSIEINMTAGNCYFRLQLYDQAMEAYRRALDIAPSFPHAYKGLSQVYKMKSMPRESEEAFKRSVELSGLPPIKRFSQDFNNWSKKDPEYLLSKLSFVFKQKYVRPTYVAKLFADYGDKDRAFDWLERAYEERDSVLLFLKTDNSWDALRADPRFNDLSKRIFLNL